MNRVKVAVVGFGHIGRRHATIVKEYSETELVGIADSNPEVQNHDLYPAGVPFFESLQDLLAGTDAEIIAICTPNGVHTKHALEALAASRHVIIEKPMGLSRSACEKVIFRALQVSRQVFVVKQNRYSPPSKWLKQVVDEGRLGDIYQVQINCYWNRDDRYYKADSWKGSLELDGGILFTQFSHFIDIMYWVFGDIGHIQSSFADYNHTHNTEFEDTGMAQFEFVNGGKGCINFSTAVWDKNMESSITVIGEKGSLKIGGQYMNDIEYCHIDNYEKPVLPPTNPPNDYGPFTGSAANHHFVFENVVNTLRGKDTITANALEGLKVVDIIERIYEQRDLSRIKKPTK